MEQATERRERLIESRFASRYNPDVLTRIISSVQKLIELLYEGLQLLLGGHLPKLAGVITAHDRSQDLMVSRGWKDFV